MKLKKKLKHFYDIYLRPSMVKFKIQFFFIVLQNFKRNWWKLASFDHHMHGYLAFSMRMHNEVEELNERIDKLEQKLKGDSYEYIK